MKSLIDFYGEMIGFEASLPEDSDFIYRLDMQTAFTQDAYDWIFDNLTNYEVTFGLRRCWITIRSEEERVHFKLRWYK